MRWPEFSSLLTGLLVTTRPTRLSHHFFPPKPDPPERDEMEEG